MSRFLQIFCTILSALLIALAIPNEILSYGSPLIGLFALYPFYLALARPNSLCRAFGLCFLHGALAHLLSSFWLGNFMGFAVFTLGASDIGTGFFEAFFSLGFYAPALLSPKSMPLEERAGIRHFAVPMRILSFSAVYVIWEYCKSTGFLAYPWGTLSMTASRWRAITQIADITGVYGITFLFALFSACLGEGTLLLKELPGSQGAAARLSSYKGACLLTLALFVISMTYGSFQLSKKREPVKTMSTILVQQNRNPDGRFEDMNIRHAQKLTQERLDELSADGEKCDLVVWSEAVLSQRFPAAQIYYTYYPGSDPLLSFIRRSGSYFVIGGPVTFSDERHEYGNSALIFDGNGKFIGSYTKMHLVPFAEQIPFSGHKIVQRLIKRMIGFSYGWTPGTDPAVFEIPLSSRSASALISTPICFDDSAHEVCRALFKSGSEIFVNITNDSWSGTDSAEIQHFVVAHYRSIEYRSTMIRSANAGYTCVIDPTGKVLADLPLFEDGALSFKVPIYGRERTVYSIFGDWLPYSLILLFMASILKKAHERRKLSLDFTGGNS